jgi:RNA polymerase sigma factor (TIGR02999 family)
MHCRRFPTCERGCGRTWKRPHAPRASSFAARMELTAAFSKRRNCEDCRSAAFGTRIANSLQEREKTGQPTKQGDRLGRLIPDKLGLAKKRLDCVGVVLCTSEAGLLSINPYSLSSLRKHNSTLSYASEFGLNRWQDNPDWGKLYGMSDVTVMLDAMNCGESRASEELLSLVYEELRRLAAARMAQESAGQTLQPTALVHEAWLQLVGAGERTWQNRAHFFGAAADAMRRILIDKARRKSRLKHGGGQTRLDIDDLELAETTPDDNVLLINEALEQLEKEDPQQARVVVLKFFAGLTNLEVAESLGIAERTVDRQWACAKARLFRWIRS